MPIRMITDNNDDDNDNTNQANTGWNLLDFSIVVSSVVDQWMIPLVLLIAKETT